MKKLLFILVFTFIGQYSFSQMYIVTLSFVSATHPSGCDSDNTNELCLTKTEPSGAQTYTCIQRSIVHSSTPLSILNQELNNIINQGQGYKLIETNNGDSNKNGLIDATELNYGTTWYFAIPWTSNVLEEVATTLKSFIISPNPANTFVDISLYYSLKGESEIVFISEGGYISHKESIREILKNEKHNIDISKIPTGKYLVTIVNGKTYTTPQKLIVL